MNNYSLIMIVLILAPAILLTLTAIHSYFQKGSSPRNVIKLSFAAAIAGILVSAGNALWVYFHGTYTSSILGLNGLGFSLRLDTLSVMVLLMISLLSFIILKFSYNYMEGDQRHGIFIGRLALTIAAVQLLVLSGNILQLFLFWIATSMALHRLLLFYPERPRAATAAKKKFIMARMGDAFLLVSVIIIYRYFGTGDLQQIFNYIKQQASPSTSLELNWAAVCMVMAALLKSAQFPTHGWLVEVMETPTPVSSLLHAGLLNAGPFLIIRMAYLVQLSPIASFILIIVGGLTALFASAIFLTQSSIKRALAYSSIAHMGFSLLICGVGVFPAALLHMMAHSFYKAHAFLSSGSSIEMIRAAKLKNPVRFGSPLRIMLGMVLVAIIYIAIASMIGVNPIGNFGLFFTGSVVVMGLIQLMVSSTDSSLYLESILRSCLYAALIVIAFFTLEGIFQKLLQSQIPLELQPNAWIIIPSVTVLALFLFAISIQLSSKNKQSKWTQNIAVHFRNDLYVNIIFDRWIGALKMKHSKNEITIN